MSWTYEDSVERAKNRWQQTDQLSVSDVVREIDFDLISRTQPRRVLGTHFYADVSNYNKLLSSGAEAAEMIRLLHIFAREASTIVGTDFDGQKIHFQGPRLHGLAYRPINNEPGMAAKAVLTCAAIRHMTDAFNEQFDLLENDAWIVAAGLDHGRCIATRNGAGGDQELLFLGHAANHAAHTLADRGIRLTAAVRDQLPSEFDSFISETADGIYSASISPASVEELANAYGWKWTPQATVSRLADLAEKYPVGCVTSSSVKKEIDKASVTLSNSKYTFAVSLFADVDGFTSYIDGLTENDDNLVEAVRYFHALRGEMRDTAVVDFDAFRIQYQGDRMQAVAYRPVGDAESTALRAVELAAALITVAGEVTPEATGVSDPSLPVAIGLAAGDVVITRIGEHGNTDLVSIGASTARAASIQERISGGQIGIDAELRALLPDWLQSLFKWSPGAKAYVVDELSYDNFVTLGQSEQSDRAIGVVIGVAAAAGIAAAGVAGVLKARNRLPAEPARPWSNI